MNLPSVLRKKTSGKNFFELPSREKKKLIKEAVRGSNELQTKLAREYDRFAY